MISSWESLHFATLELVRSAPIKQRLMNAYRRHLSIIAKDEIPTEVRESFSHVMNVLNAIKPQVGEDSVAASTRKMSLQEADECSALIVEIYGVTCRALVTAARSNNLPFLHQGHQSIDFEDAEIMENQ